VSTIPIRTYGDPALKSATKEVEDIDARLVALVDQMFETMYAAPGSGLAANQVGVQKRLFVYDAGDGPRVVINPRIVETGGEYTMVEGCLSVPGLSWEITRPNEVYLVGLDLDGNEVAIETDEYEGRVFQHEMDHLDGILLIERLDDDQRREAKRLLRELSVRLGTEDPDGLGSLLDR
jgi:peptide deformylase